MSVKPVPPPSPQEVHRKLSVYAKPVKKPPAAPATLSGTESDSDSQQIDAAPPHAHGTSSSMSQHRLQSIAERRSISGDETDEDEEDEGAWRVADKAKGEGAEEVIMKSGYLWKKGSRRKTWKKRWFVLRSPHLAYYKTSAEYKLLRLLHLSEVHAVTPVTLKRHENTFGLVLPTRTFYLQADSQEEVLAWVRALNEVRERLQQSASTITPLPTPPINIPSGRPPAGAPLTPVTPSPPNHAVTSSDEDEGLPQAYSSSPGPGVTQVASLPKSMGPPVGNDPGKVVLSGYLMKCGSKRKQWRKRWFVLTGEKLVYCGNHMDNKHQRQMPLSQILDAMEYAVPSHRHGGSGQSVPPGGTPPVHAALDELADPHSGQGENHTFKIVTTKRSLLLCAPSEEEEIRWLSAVRALIARRSGAAGSGSSKTGAASGGEGASASAPGHGGKGGSGQKRIGAGGLVAAVEEVVGGAT